MEKSTTTTGNAYNYICNAILSGSLAQGSPVSEIELSQAIGVSRSPVREALRQLEAEGLVVIFPGRGTFVTQITSQDIREIFELRILLENGAIKRAYKYIKDDVLADLKSKIEALDPQHPDPEQFYILDKALHSTIIQNCGNKRMIKLYETLLLQMAMIRRISGQAAEHFSMSREYHLKLIEALQNRDLEKATVILNEHLKNVFDNTIKFFTYN